MSASVSEHANVTLSVKMMARTSQNMKPTGAYPFIHASEQIADRQWKLNFAHKAGAP
jgi:hypothetical protein